MISFVLSNVKQGYLRERAKEKDGKKTGKTSEKTLSGETCPCIASPECYERVMICKYWTPEKKYQAKQYG